MDKVGTDQTKTAAAEAEVPVDESSRVGGWESIGMGGTGAYREGREEALKG